MDSDFAKLARAFRQQKKSKSPPLDMVQFVISFDAMALAAHAAEVDQSCVVVCVVLFSH